MLEALNLSRRAANEGQSLSFELLSRIQWIVLGKSATFRKRDAFAKHGKERYAYWEHAQEEFERCLSQSADPNTPLVVRAARVYLDICFFHPFDDGNGRAARLALDFVLTQDKYRLHAVEPIFNKAHPYLPNCLAHFAQAILELVGPIRD
jgi:prophage maintenance system killer protein